MNGQGSVAAVPWMKFAATVATDRVAVLQTVAAKAGAANEVARAESMVASESWRIGIVQSMVAQELVAMEQNSAVRAGNVVRCAALLARQQAVIVATDRSSEGANMASPLL